jgi:hypothetical protein
MTWMQRSLAGVGTAVLAVLSLAACGGSDHPSDAATTGAASVADFCSTWEDALNGLAATGASGPSDEQWDAVRADLEKLAEIGAPDQLSREAAAGLKVFTDALTGLSAADMRRLRNAQNLPGVTDADEASARKFNSESAALCKPGEVGTK